MSAFSGIFSDLLSRIRTVENKVNTLETVEYIKFYPITSSTVYVIDTAINAGVTYTTGNLRGTAGISERAKGFVGTMWIDVVTGTCTLRIVPGNDTPNAYTQQYRWLGGVDTDRQLMSQMVFGFLGNVNGDISIQCLTTNCHVYVTAFGYWE